MPVEAVAMSLKIAVLAHHSLLADGIASRLREHAGQIEVQTVEAGAVDLPQRLQRARPAIVLMDSTDAEAVENMPLDRLWALLPETRVMRLDPASDHVRVFSCERWRVPGIDGLIAALLKIGPVGRLAAPGGARGD